MLGPFTFLKLGPVRRAREAFAVGGVEAEGHGEAAFAEHWVGGEGEAFLELHLGFGGVVDVAELDGAAAGPGEGEGHQLIEPTELAFVEMLMEGGQKERGLSFFVLQVCERVLIDHRSPLALGSPDAASAVGPDTRSNPSF